MHSTVIRGGTIVDGTGRPSFTGDVAMDGDRIAQVGGKAGPGKREIDAAGLLVTPGWVDAHTHYDGQATWDPMLAPSSWHGVTTILFGNCGVGFAPVRRKDHEQLIALMEAVEEIPGIALTEGLKWNWESFPEYLECTGDGCRAPSTSRRKSRTTRYGSMSWASARSTWSGRPAEDIAEMRRLTEEALRAGAFGFTTSRTNSHKTLTGGMVPSRYSEIDELLGIGRALGAVGHGAFGMNSDFDIEESELGWMTQLGQETGRPVWFLLTDRPNDVERWRRLMEGVRAARAKGAMVTAQIAGRPVGVLLGADTALNPFSIRAQLPGAAEAAGRRAHGAACRTRRCGPRSSPMCPRTSCCHGSRSSASISPAAGTACSSWATRRITSRRRARASPPSPPAKAAPRTRSPTTTWRPAPTTSCSSRSSATTRTTTTSSAPC